MAGSDLVISVGASIRDLERQMKAAAKLAEQRADEIEATFKRVNPSVDFGVGMLKGAVAAASIDRIARSFVDANKEIASFGATAQRVGLDLAEFQKLRLAAQGEGVSGKSFDSGIEGLAEKLNEARTQENDLSRLFEANNVKLRDRKGEVISTNEALTIAAELIRRAATEMDKIEIAKMVGLTREWIPLLEGGAQALEQAKTKAAETGAILEKEIVDRAAEFDKAWEQGWAAFSSHAKAATAPVLEALQGLVNKAREIGAAIPKALEQARQGAAEREVAAIEANLARDPGRTPQQRRGLEEQLERARATLRASQGRQQLLDDAVPVIPFTMPRDPGKPTVKPSDEKKSRAASAGGGGKTEEEQAQDRLDRYIDSLVRQRAVMEAEVATVGKSNAERKAAVEIARAQVDLDKLSTSEKANYIAKLTEEVSKNEEVRASKERLEQAQKGLNDAQKYFGNAAVDALEDLIINGAKAEDVVKRLAASLAKAALQAALMGNGPLAGIFGTAGTGGNMGGLFGMFGSMFGRATGGPVNAGQAYRVGERGPETFVPTTPGKIIPAGRGGGGITVNVQNNTPAQVETKPRPDGGFDMIISQVEGAMAQRMLRGQGSLSQAFAARQTNRHLRG